MLCQKRWLKQEILLTKTSWFCTSKKCRYSTYIFMIDKFHELELAISSFGMSDILEWTRELLDSNILLGDGVISRTAQTNREQIKNKYQEGYYLTVMRNFTDNCYRQRGKMIRNHQDQISGVTDHKERSLYFVTHL